MDVISNQSYVAVSGLIALWEMGTISKTVPLFPLVGGSIVGRQMQNFVIKKISRATAILEMKIHTNNDNE